MKAEDIERREAYIVTLPEGEWGVVRVQQRARERERPQKRVTATVWCDECEDRHPFTHLEPYGRPERLFHVEPLYHQGSSPAVREALDSLISRFGRPPVKIDRPLRSVAFERLWSDEVEDAERRLQADERRRHEVDEVRWRTAVDRYIAITGASPHEQFPNGQQRPRRDGVWLPIAQLEAAVDLMETNRADERQKAADGGEAYGFGEHDDHD